ncbi:MAG: hypothetical protein Q9212_004415 [Teloschistes hypoglaucus]
MFSTGINGLPNVDVSQNASAVETTSEERPQFDKWIGNLQVHYQNQQAPFSQKKNGWSASQFVRVSTSPLRDSGHPNPNEQKYAFVRTWSRRSIYWTIDLDGRQAIVVPVVNGPRAAFVEWVGIVENFKATPVAFTDHKDIIRDAREYKSLDQHTARGQRSQPSQQEKQLQSPPLLPIRRRRQATDDNNLANPRPTKSRTGEIVRQPPKQRDNVRDTTETVDAARTFPQPGETQAVSRTQNAIVHRGSLEGITPCHNLASTTLLQSQTPSTTSTKGKARKQEIRRQMARVGQDVLGVLGNMLRDMSDDEDGEEEEAE